MRYIPATLLTIVLAIIVIITSIYLVRAMSDYLEICNDMQLITDDIDNIDTDDIIHDNTFPYTLEEYEQRRIDAHDMAELARKLGLKENSEVISIAQDIWNDATAGIEYHKSQQPQQWWTEDELHMLAAVIFYEAGSNDCTDRHQQLVGQVVLNRVKSNEFPNTIYDVVTQTKPTLQYSTYKSVLKNMGNKDIIPQRCYDNALMVLNGEVDCPDNIVWQAGFKQGSGIYESYKTPYSTTYFCYR